MTALSELRKLQDQAAQGAEERPPVSLYNQGYFAGYMDALREAIEIAEAEEDG